MKIADLIKFGHKLGATKRTKNRIRENGPTFIIHSCAQEVSFDSGLWIRVESVAKNSSNGQAWHGWLPQKEIEVIK